MWENERFEVIELSGNWKMVFVCFIVMLWCIYYIMKVMRIIESF